MKKKIVGASSSKKVDTIGHQKHKFILGDRKEIVEPTEPIPKNIGIPEKMKDKESKSEWQGKRLSNNGPKDEEVKEIVQIPGYGEGVVKRKFRTKENVIVQEVEGEGKLLILKKYSNDMMIYGEQEARISQEISKDTEFTPRIIYQQKKEKEFSIFFEFGGLSLEDLRSRATEKLKIELVKPTEEKKGEVSETREIRYFANAEEYLMIMWQVSNALKAVHAKKKIHSDIKPENILYDKAKRKAALIDFDITLEFPEEQDIFATYKEEEEVRVKGATNRYLPPEMLFHPQDIEIPSSIDAYCFGLTFYQIFLDKTSRELINENTELKKDEKSYATFLHQVKQIQLPNDPNREICSKISELLLACLAFNPRKRPSMRSIESILQEIPKSKGSYEENKALIFKGKKVTKNEISFTNPDSTRSLTSFEAFILAQTINTEAYLSKLVVNNYELDGVKAELLMNALIDHPMIEFINFSTILDQFYDIGKNLISPECAGFINHAFRYNLKLKTAFFGTPFFIQKSIGSNKLGDASMKLIGSGIANSGTLIEISLSMVFE